MIIKSRESLSFELREGEKKISYNMTLTKTGSRSGDRGKRKQDDSVPEGSQQQRGRDMRYTT